MDLGTLLKARQPWHWVADGLCPIKEVARILASRHQLAFEWFWPKRLTLDLEAADRFADDEVTQALGLRLHHSSEIDVPLYVFQTGLTKGSVFAAAERLRNRSRIAEIVKVDAPQMGHLDPLFARVGRNSLAHTLPQFIHGQ